MREQHASLRPLAAHQSVRGLLIVAPLVESGALRTFEDDNSKSREEVLALPIDRQDGPECLELRRCSDVQLRLQHFRMNKQNCRLLLSQPFQDQNHDERGGENPHACQQTATIFLCLRSSLPVLLITKEVPIAVEPSSCADQGQKSDGTLDVSKHDRTGLRHSR